MGSEKEAVAEQLLESDATITVAEQAEVANRVDAFGSASAELKAKLAELEPLQKLVAELKTGLVEEGKNFPADEKVYLQGYDFRVALSKAPKEVTEINKELLRDAVGSDVYFDLAKVAIGDIRKYCTPPQIEEILTEELTGTRRIKAEKK